MLPTGFKNIPEYKAHSVVRAFKIARIDRTGQTNYLVATAEEITPIPLQKEVLDQHNPSEGDYYVLYPNGEFEFTPAKFFEDNYDQQAGSTSKPSNPVSSAPADSKLVGGDKLTDGVKKAEEDKKKLAEGVNSHNLK